LPPSSRSPWCPLLAALQSLCLLGQPSSPPPTTTIDQETRELCPFADQGAAHRPRSATAGQAQLHSLLDLQGCLQFPLPRPEIVVVRDLFVKWALHDRLTARDPDTRYPKASTSGRPSSHLRLRLWLHALGIVHPSGFLHGSNVLPSVT
jgi:hypothetical protein